MQYINTHVITPARSDYDNKTQIKFILNFVSTATAFIAGHFAQELNSVSSSQDKTDTAQWPQKHV